MMEVLENDVLAGRMADVEPLLNAFRRSFVEIS